MVHFWIIEAETAQELNEGVKRELKAGARLDGAPFVSRGKKHYQAVRREISQLKPLDAGCLGNLEAFQIN